jgi:hypothetical protein
MRRLQLIAGTLALVLIFKWIQQRPGSSTSETPNPSDIVLPMEYMDAASALAQDDFAGAQRSLTALAKASTGDLQSRAQIAANAADIEATREAFKTLSEEVATNRSYPDHYAVAFCGTYKGGTKWIQKRDAPIANPYTGKAAPPCGAFVD